MSRRVVLSGSTRARVVLALMLALLAVLSAPAMAAEEGGAAATEAAEEDHGAPSINEIGTQNEVSQQYLPEPAEPPPFMRFLYVPLAIAGVLVIAGLLFLYLVWQPRFAEERRSKRRR